MHENKFVGETQQVTLKPFHRPPEVDERLPDEVLSEETKRRYVSECQKYIGQLMWLATRTRPDISAVLGICASMMVKTPQKVAAHLVDLWRYVWTTRRFAMSTLSHAMGPSSTTLPPAMGSLNALSSMSGVQHGIEMEESTRQDGGLDGKERLLTERPEFHIHAYTDASFFYIRWEESVRISCLFGSTRNGRIFGPTMVLEETNDYCLFGTRG